MPVLERNDSPVMDRGADTHVFTRDLADPNIVEIRKPTLADHYDLGAVLIGPGAMGTTVIYTLNEPMQTLVLPFERPPWETWLPEIVAPRPTRTAVSQQIEDIQEITGLSDSQLAATFPGGVSRETVNRWRNRPNPNLRSGNLYRLGVLHQLARRLEEAGVHASVWLHQPVEGEPTTPFDLICGGQLGRVQAAVEAIAAGFGGPAERMRRTPSLRDWDAGVEEDEGEWSWADAEEDGD